MKTKGLSVALANVSLELATAELERAKKLATIYALIKQAEEAAFTLEHGCLRKEALPVLEAAIAEHIDVACMIEAEIGLDKLGRLADDYAIPLGNDVPS